MGSLDETMLNLQLYRKIFTLCWCMGC